MSKPRIIAVHQPNFIPWLGYFYKMKQADAFVILDNVDLQIGNAASITNRTKIKTPQGELMIVVPLKKSESKLISEIKIDVQQPWAKKMLKTIQLNYTKAKYFADYFPTIEKILNGNADGLSALNISFIRQCAVWLNITTEILIASEMNLQAEDKNERLIEICKILNGNIYFSGNGAKKYNNEELFTAANINLQYTSYTPQAYTQLHGNFISGLSVIDTLMNCGEATIDLLK